MNYYYRLSCLSFKVDDYERTHRPEVIADNMRQIHVAGPHPALRSYRFDTPNNKIMDIVVANSKLEWLHLAD